MSLREFEYSDANSFKFWKIDLSGTDVVTRYGRIGSDGQQTKKSFASAAAAQKAYDKLVAEKLGKGYVEVTKGAAPSTADSKAPAVDKATSPKDAPENELSPMMFNTTRDGQFSLTSTFIGERVTDFRQGKPTQGKKVFRVRVSYDDEGGDDESSFEDRLRAFLANDAAPATKGLILGAYDLEGGSSGHNGYQDLIAGKDRLPNLRALFIGDILQEESEISWIQNSDVSPILAAFPQLELFRIRGADGLEFSQPRHPKLRALAIESGGLPAKVVSQICRGTFPELEYLELWLGTPDYDGDCRVNDLQPIFKGEVFPKLKYLGLRNAEIADDIAAVVAKAPVVDALDTLDLSLGNLSDEGANALLQIEAKHLKRLDLHHHYISKPLLKKLKQLPFTVDVSDAKSADDEEDVGGRFISVSE